MKKMYILLFALLSAAGARAQWVPQDPNTPNSLNAVYFTDENLGFAVGDSGTILRTTDGGYIWTKQNSGTISRMRAVYFTSPSTGYATSEDGSILKTSDGGTTWTHLISGTTKMLESVFFTSPDTGYVVGGGMTSSIILKTTNAGASWVQIPSGTNNILMSVYFIDANTGYAAGMAETILKTTNAGMSWSNSYSGSNQGGLNSVYFTDASTGYACGGYVNGPGVGGRILKTTNSGMSWSVISSGTYSWLYSLHFPQPGTGYAAGAEGTIIKTTNGGSTWTRQSSGIFTLTAVYFPSVNIGYAVGGSYYPESTILYTNNGGYPLGESDHSPASGTLSIFPNPATSSITVETPSPATGISILDLSGRELLQKSVLGTQFTVDITSLPSGLYLVKLTGCTSVEFGKFVKK